MRRVRPREFTVFKSNVKNKWTFFSNLVAFSQYLNFSLINRMKYYHFMLNSVSIKMKKFVHGIVKNWMASL